jgi:serine/threonine protein kinase
MAVQIGTQIGDYRLVRELGSGTFGTVYQAEHIYIGTQVAIKVLHGPITDAERVKLRRGPQPGRAGACSYCASAGLFRAARALSGDEVCP